MPQKAELQAIYDRIVAIKIPETLMGKTTKAVRDSMDIFRAALKNHLDSLGLSNADEVCLESQGYISEEMRRECLQRIISERYGVTVDDRFYPGQLRRILSALDTVGNRLTELLEQCLAESGSATTLAGILPSGDSPLPRPRQVFQVIFQDLEFHFLDSEGVWASTEGSTNITLTSDTFSNYLNPTDSDKQRIEGNILHEIGHALANMLGNVAEGTMITLRVTNLAGQSYTLDVEIPAGTPQVAVDFLVETGAYWNVTGLPDFGSNPEGGFYSAYDSGVVPLTNLRYEEYRIGSEPVQAYQPGFIFDLTGMNLNFGSGYNRDNPNHPNWYCVDTHGQGITDSNRVIYFRPPETYVGADYATWESRGVFPNEMGYTHGPDPMEGIGDSFSVLMQMGSFVDERLFSPEEPRRQFIERHICCWFRQLLGDAYPQLNELSCPESGN